MKYIRKYKHLTHAEYKRITKLKRCAHHKYTHALHYKKNISRKTLFYMKEYGPRSHIVANIVRESLKILIFASVLSTLGGIGLRSVSSELMTILPLLVLLPALNDMIGDFGTVASSKISTGLFLGKIKQKGIFSSEFVRSLFKVHLKVALVSAVYISVGAFLLAGFQGYIFNASAFLRVLGLTTAASALLVVIIFTISYTWGVREFKRGEDPNNFLIPISTAIADFGSLLIFSIGIWMLF